MRIFHAQRDFLYYYFICRIDYAIVTSLYTMNTERREYSGEMMEKQLNSIEAQLKIFFRASIWRRLSESKQSHLETDQSGIRHSMRQLHVAKTNMHSICLIFSSFFSLQWIVLVFFSEVLTFVETRIHFKTLAIWIFTFDCDANYSFDNWNGIEIADRINMSHRYGIGWCIYRI